MPVAFFLLESMSASPPPFLNSAPSFPSAEEEGKVSWQLFLFAHIPLSSPLCLTWNHEPMGRKAKKDSVKNKGAEKKKVHSCVIRFFFYARSFEEKGNASNLRFSYSGLALFINFVCRLTVTPQHFVSCKRKERAYCPSVAQVYKIARIVIVNVCLHFFLTTLKREIVR